LDQHLDGCDACRAERGQWLLIQQLRERPHPTLGPTARARLLRHLATLPSAEVTAPARPAFPWARAATAVAAGLLLVAGARLLLPAPRHLATLAASRTAATPTPPTEPARTVHPTKLARAPAARALAIALACAAYAHG